MGEPARIIHIGDAAKGNILEVGAYKSDFTVDAYRLSFGNLARVRRYLDGYRSAVRGSRILFLCLSADPVHQDHHRDGNHYLTLDCIVVYGKRTVMSPERRSKSYV